VRLGASGLSQCERLTSIEGLDRLRSRHGCEVAAEVVKHPPRHRWCW
jgi:hypothetical protein